MKQRRSYLSLFICFERPVPNSVDMFYFGRTSRRKSCMRVTRVWIMVCCVLWTSICGARLIHSQVALGQADRTKQAHVLDSVPEPKDEEFRKIRTAEDWHNPYVMVCRD